MTTQDLQLGKAEVLKPTLVVEPSLLEKSEQALREKFQELEKATLEAQRKLTENTQHVYHHSDTQPASFDVKVEKNSRSYNWTISVHGCKDRAEADKLLGEADMVVKSFIAAQTTES